MKKKITSVAACLIFCCFFVLCGKLFRYILIDDTASYTRVMFHEMYAQDNIDILFVGSSHCYRTFVPEIFDNSLNGKNTFNAGTSSQNLDGSLMVIREASKYNDIEHIYLEMFYEVAFSKYKERTEMTGTYIVSDYLKPSLDKIGYLLEASGSDHYINSFMIARRNWQKFFDADYVKNLIIKKQSDDYKNYGYGYITHENEWYEGKGYVANQEMVKEWNFFSPNGWNEINLARISDDWKKSLKDIIDFCDEKEIALTLISAPMSDFQLAGVGNYDDYVELVKDMIADTDVAYYDFNLCKKEYFPSDSELFKDTGHVNCYGAKAVSDLLSDLINGKISEKDLFYQSFKEKMRNLEPTVFGISYHDTQKEDGEAVRECKIVSTGHSDLEYQIILKPENGGEYIRQDFSNNNYFLITPDDHGICSLAFRLSGLPDQVWTLDISY